MSILFRDSTKAEDDYDGIDILMVNHDRRILSNPLEDLDEDEKLAVLTDIMNADPVQNELNLVNQEWSEVHGIFGGIIEEAINGYDCRRHKVTVQAQVKTKKKVQKRFDMTYQQYFEGAEEFKQG